MSRAILSTRTAAKDAEFATDYSGLEIFHEPMLTIRYLQSPLVAKDFDALIFTSSHAVRAFAAITGRRDCPVFTVGPQTTATAREMGFTGIIQGPGTAADLRPLLPKNLRLLHPCGRVVRDELPATRLIVYDAVPAEALSPACLARLSDRGFAAILLFSPRGAAIFRELFLQAPVRPNALKATKALCLSGAVLESAASLDWQELHAAETPDRAGMLALLRREIES